MEPGVTVQVLLIDAKWKVKVRSTMLEGGGK